MLPALAADSIRPALHSHDLYTPAMSDWPPRAPRTLLVAALLAAVALAWNAKLLNDTLIHTDAIAPGDFFALWTFGQFALARPLAGIYDPAALHSFQMSFGVGDGIAAPYPYAPSFALLLAPFALLPLRAAYFAFVGLTLAAYLLAACGRSWRLMLATLILPTTAIGLATGQNGFLSAALLLGGLRLLPTRPVLAGILFGLLTYKPQLGLLVPVALLAGRHWRAIASACATALAGVLVIGLACGWRVWPAWIDALRGQASDYLTPAQKLGQIMPTIHAAVLNVGGGTLLAGAAQFVAFLAAAIIVWRYVKTLPVATFLATPYAFAYDLPMAASAALGYVQEKVTADKPFRLLEIAILAAAGAMPIALSSPGPFPAGPVTLVLLLLVMARR